MHVCFRITVCCKLLVLLCQVVKVADFGVARVQSQSGVMTAETGTYRWMAPEVCIFLLCILYMIVISYSDDLTLYFSYSCCFMIIKTCDYGAQVL